MSEILIDHVLLDRVTKDAKESPRLRMNYNFHESLSSPSQRLLNALEPGTVLPIHRHRHTAETYVLLRGRMRVLFYDDDKKEINRYELDPAEGTYGVNIPRGQWHTIEVLCASPCAAKDRTNQKCQNIHRHDGGAHRRPRQNGDQNAQHRAAH